MMLGGDARLDWQHKRMLMNAPPIQVDQEEWTIPQVLGAIRAGHLWLVNPRRRNGLILYKDRFYAEFAGPGAIIGGEFDRQVQHLEAVGNLSLLPPGDRDELRRAHLIRRQWIMLFKQITHNPVPTERAQMIVNQFDNWFDRQTTAAIDDHTFALMVGVLPQTIRRIRSGDNPIDM